MGEGWRRKGEAAASAGGGGLGKGPGLEAELSPKCLVLQIEQKGILGEKTAQAKPRRSRGRPGPGSPGKSIQLETGSY